MLYTLKICNINCIYVCNIQSLLFLFKINLLLLQLTIIFVAFIWSVIELYNYVLPLIGCFPGQLALERNFLGFRILLQPVDKMKVIDEIFLEPCWMTIKSHFRRTDTVDNVFSTVAHRSLQFCPPIDSSIY